MTSTLPPIDVDSWVEYSGVAFKESTDKRLAGITSHGWDLDALDKIESLTPRAASVSAVEAPANSLTDGTDWATAADAKIEALNPAPLETVPEDDPYERVGQQRPDTPTAPASPPRRVSGFTQAGEALTNLADQHRDSSWSQAGAAGAGVLRGAGNALRQMGSSANAAQESFDRGDVAGAAGNTLAGVGAGLNAPGSVAHGAARGAGIQDAYDVNGVPVPAADALGLAADLVMPQRGMEEGLRLAGRGVVALPRYGEKIVADVGRMADEAGGWVPLLERGEARLPGSDGISQRLSGYGTRPIPPKALDKLASTDLPPGAVPITKTAAQEVERLRLDKFPEDVRPLIQEGAERMGFATGQRRGVISDAAAETMADDLGRTTEQWIRQGKAGRAYNTEEVRALANAITTQATKVREVGQAVAKPGGNSDLAIAQQMIEGDKLAALTALREGSKAEAGRALRAFAQEARLGTNPDDAIAHIFAKVGGADNARAMSSEYATMVEQGASPIEMAKFWAKVEAPPVGFGDWFTALRYNSMLSGPRTFAVNLIGNTLEVPWRLARDVGASTARAAGTRSVEPLREVGTEMAGLYAGAQKGAKAFMEVLRHGITEEQALRGDMPRDIATRLDPTQAGRFPGVVRAVQPVARTLESVGKLLSATDEFARQAAYGMAKGRLAAREATRQGLRGKAWEAEYERVMADFVPRLERQAMSEADRMTYKGEMGGLGRLLSAAQRSDHQALKVGSNLVLPFLRTVYHISSRGVDRSPLGIIGTGIDVARGKYGRGDQLGRALSGEMLPNAEKGLVPLGERLGDNAIGGLMSLWFTQQALQGNISGAGPDNGTQRDVLRAQGWQPYSIKVGDSWVSYSNWGPVSIPLAAAAGVGEAVTYRKPKANTADLFADAAGRFAKLAADQPYLQGIGAIYKATQDSERFGQTWLTSTLGTLLPFGAALNTAGQAFDPIERQADPGDIGGAVSKRIPGLRERLPEARTALGDVQPNPFAGASALSPLRVSSPPNQATANVRRFNGSKSAAEDYQIAQAVDRVTKWQGKPSEYEKPTSQEFDLWRKFGERENPRYQRLISEANAKERRDRLARKPR